MTWLRGLLLGLAIAAVVAAGIGLVPPTISALAARAGDSGLDLGRIVQGLAWTPLGAPWAVPGDISTGHPWRASARGAIAVAVAASTIIGQAVTALTFRAFTRA